MISRKIAALAMCAVMAASAAMTVTAGAVDVQTAEVVREYAAAPIVWNGTTALKDNSSYIVTGEITVSSKITIPENTTVSVKSGARLTVSKKGTLIVNGRLNVNSGSSMMVFGTMKLNSGKRITSSGDFRFGSASNITLDGIFAINNGGTLQGEPASFSTASDSTLKIYGKNFCKKVAEVANERSLVTIFDELYTAAIIDNDIYSVVKKTVPAKALAEAESIFKAEGSSLSAYCKTFGDQYQKDLKSEGIDVSKITDVTASINKVTDITGSLTSEQIMQLYSYYPGYTKVVKAEMNIALNGTGKSEAVEATMVLIGKNWYMM